MLAHAPDSEQLQDLAQEYGADKDRFEKEASFCIHCGLCVRYCAEVKKKHAVGFIDRGAKKEISFIPEIACHGVLGLQGVLSPLPYIGTASSVRVNQSAFISLFPRPESGE